MSTFTNQDKSRARAVFEVDDVILKSLLFSKFWFRKLDWTFFDKFLDAAFILKSGVSKTKSHMIIETANSSHDAVSKMCQLEISFQNLPFPKPAGKKCAVFVWTGGLSVIFFAVFKMCRHRVIIEAVVATLCGFEKDHGIGASQTVADCHQWMETQLPRSQMEDRNRRRS